MCRLSIKIYGIVDIYESKNYYNINCYCTLLLSDHMYHQKFWRVCLLFSGAFCFVLNESDLCTDFPKFLEFRKAYRFGPSVKNIPVFTTIEEREHSRIVYNCNDIFQYKPEQRITENPLNLREVQQAYPDYVDGISMDSEVPLTEYFINDPSIKLASQVTVWDKAAIIALSKQRCTCGQYENDSCEIAFRKYQSHIKGKMGIVVGSYHFWAEAAALRFGAKRILTVEYNHIYTSHRKMSAMTPSAFAKYYLDGKHKLVDFVISYSSLEHDGLGRYGDPLNANGDLLTITKVNCMLKPGGILFLGLPLGRDEVQFNAHRIYGYRRLSVLVSLGFDLIDIVSDKEFTIDKYNGDSTQPVLVLRKQHDVGASESNDCNKSVTPTQIIGEEL